MLTKMMTGPTKTFASIQTLAQKLEQAKAYYLSLVQPARLFFKGVNGVNIHYVADICEKEQAALVIVPGWAETGLRYAELMLDLKPYNLSYYILDLRGMGFSDRLLADREKTHVDKFQDYVDDLKIFIATVVAAPHKKIFILAHSLGGLVTARYLEQDRHVFDGAVLSSPLLDIGHPLLPKQVISGITQTGEFLGRGPNYALGQKPAAPKNLFAAGNTHSYERWKFFEDIQQTYPEIKKGGMTNHWLQESIHAMHDAVQDAAKIVTPTLVLQAGHDGFVPSKGQNIFCQNAGIERILFPEALHEILMETDVIRSTALDAIKDFFL